MLHMDDTIIIMMSSQRHSHISQGKKIIFKAKRKYLTNSIKRDQ